MIEIIHIYTYRFLSIFRNHFILVGVEENPDPIPATIGMRAEIHSDTSPLHGPMKTHSQQDKGRWVETDMDDLKLVDVWR